MAYGHFDHPSFETVSFASGICWSASLCALCSFVATFLYVYVIILVLDGRRFWDFARSYFGIPKKMSVWCVVWKLVSFYLKDVLGLFLVVLWCVVNTSVICSLELLFFPLLIAEFSSLVELFPLPDSRSLQNLREYRYCPPNVCIVFCVLLMGWIES